jgi:hypothetical protein
MTLRERDFLALPFADTALQGRQVHQALGVGLLALPLGDTAPFRGRRGFIRLWGWDSNPQPFG